MYFGYTLGQVYQFDPEKLPKSSSEAIRNGSGVYYDPDAKEVRTVEGLGPEDMQGYDKSVKDKAEGISETTGTPETEPESGAKDKSKNKSKDESKPSNKPYKNNKEANKQAQKQGYKDAHELKEQYVGKNNVAKYDMKYDTKTGEIYLESKDGKIQIPTGLKNEP